MDRAFDGVGRHDAPCLIGEEIDRMRGVVPQQMVRPRTRLALGVDVAAAEEIGLHIHLLDVEFASGNAVVHILVAGVKATGMADHAGLAGFLGDALHILGIGP